MIGSLESVNLDRNPNRRYRVGTASSIENVPPLLRSCSPHFILLLAIDATSVGNERIRSVARKLLDDGLAGLDVWGPDCGRVHNQFDLERDPNETDGRVVMTTWHDDEPLSEVVWSFDYCSWPSGEFEHDCTDWIAVAVGNEVWEQEIRSGLCESTEDDV